MDTYYDLVTGKRTNKELPLILYNLKTKNSQNIYSIKSEYYITEKDLFSKKILDSNLEKKLSNYISLYYNLEDNPSYNNNLYCNQDKYVSHINMLKEQKERNKFTTLVDLSFYNIEKKPKHYLPSVKEWKNSIYSYNKEYIKHIFTFTKNTEKLVHSYFNKWFREDKPIYKRLRKHILRLSSKKTFISRAEIKHTGEKVSVIFYSFNKENNFISRKLEKIFEGYIIRKIFINYRMYIYWWNFLKFFYKNFYKNMFTSNKLYKYETFIKLLLKELKKFFYNKKFFFKKNYIHILTETLLLYKKNFYRKFRWKMRKNKSLYKKNFFIWMMKKRIFFFIIKWIWSKNKIFKAQYLARKWAIMKNSELSLKSSIKNIKVNIRNIKMNKKNHLFINNLKQLFLSVEKSTNVTDLKNYEKQLFKRFVRKLFSKAIKQISIFKKFFFYAYIFKNVILLFSGKGLNSKISEIFDRKVKFDIVNLKYIHLNSDIFSNSIALKLKDRNNRLLKVLKKALTLVKLPPLNLLIKSIDNNPYINGNLLQVLNTMKYKVISGVRLQGSGRLTRRLTASRSISKHRYKGNLKNIYSSFKNISTVVLRGYLKPNIQYAYTESKTRNGAFGLKSWVSSF